MMTVFPEFRGLKAVLAAALVSATALAGAPGVASVAGVVTVGAGVMMADVAMAGQKAIPGIGIRVRKNPGSATRIKPTTTAADGSFRFTGLEPGNYEVTVGENKPQMVVVGKDGVLAGKVLGDKNKAGVLEYSYKPQKSDGSLSSD
jgi:Carboxypeptidase regulatory-like domain